ncbi:O-acetyl-ADP-ribose deacetylase (regulator of RNase III) [Chitinophaga skermanii]|uniref:O-acetyl-ADP-ribose deacetylase (Regulator of RNase III) n=1 Tax=Chitinophaga skermanii TaxID=331697 RepID=A0A327QYE8_9BACT|nr:O-acetyl-ADP-ribose deacetylase [Chitinophaga skermanii]RAJ08788.1 O-acetyl-ADP-ribose deacetylase (regulator of RNase III) [Chitinophaga skermanii]
MITLQQGDITKVKVDAIVNAANSSLLGGGGVDGAIHRAGGNAILEACVKIRNKQGSCKTGEAVITTGGNLPAKFVIHTVGPVWNGGNNNEPQLLENAYRNSLQLAVDNNLQSVAFPNISTGIYHFPKEIAADIAVTAAKDFLMKHPEMDITFVCFDKENYDLYNALL